MEISDIIPFFKIALYFINFTLFMRKIWKSEFWKIDPPFFIKVGEGGPTYAYLAILPMCYADISYLYVPLHWMNNWLISKT